MPVRNTTGNSRPLAVCSVISVTTPSPLSGLRSPGGTTPSAAGDLVGVGDERDLLEELTAGPRRAARRPRSPSLGRQARRQALLELGRHRLQLAEVLDAGLVLRVAGGLQLGEVAALGRGSASTSSAGVEVSHQLAQLVEQRDEVLDLVERAGGDAGRLVGPPQRLPERDALAARERLDARLGAVADAALGDVEDAPQAHGVLGVGEDPQVGEQVADLLALVEAHAADDLVRQADADEDLFEHTRLRVGAVEDRDVDRA